MKTGILVLLILASRSAFSQDGVNLKITLNEQTLLSIANEKLSANFLKIDAKELEKKGSFVVTYWEMSPTTGDSAWIRTIAIFDESDQELYKRDSLTMQLSNSVLQSLFRKNKKIKIFTWALPSDPELASRVRVRRIHLCTVELK